MPTFVARTAVSKGSAHFDSGPIRFSIFGRKKPVRRLPANLVSDPSQDLLGARVPVSNQPRVVEGDDREVDRALENGAVLAASLGVGHTLLATLLAGWPTTYAYLDRRFVDSPGIWSLAEDRMSLLRLKKSPQLQA
jgi:hypothetical protein